MLGSLDKMTNVIIDWLLMVVVIYPVKEGR